MEHDHPQRQRIFYKSLPKVELHRHLEGSLRLSTMVDIAREYSLDIPFDDVDKIRPMVQIMDGEPFTYQNFLSKFQTLRLFYQSPEVIKRITRESIADAAADNIHYMELRFTPVALTRIKDFPLGEAIDWVAQSASEAAKEYGVHTKLIVSINRHESLELAESVIKLAIDRKNGCVAGLDMAGSEADFSGVPFAGLFREAREEGLAITIHAGEWAGPESVLEAINVLGATRIGHGVRVMEDQKVVEVALEKKSTFEVCATSNYQSGVVHSLYDHPLRKMLHAGLDVTINTDDPSLSQIDLSDEYELACEGLNLNIQELQSCILASANAAFMSEEERKTLIQTIKTEFHENGV